MTIHFIRPIGVPETVDVSHWQGPLDFAKLFAQGVRNVLIKCTDGAHDVDSRYEKNVTRARAAGLKVGSYHFMQADQDPEAQADNFLAHAMTGQPGDFLHTLDAEWNIKHGHDAWLDVGPGAQDPGARAGVIIAMLGRFCLRIREKSGQFPILYSGSWWTGIMGRKTIYSGSHGTLDFSQLKFWCAAYVQLLTDHLMPAPWESNGPAIWQYSGDSTLDGVGTITKKIDFNKILVPQAQLLFPAAHI